MLASSPEAVAEEWAIHSHENFEGIELGEFDSFATVARLAVGIRTYGRAFAHFANWRGTKDATLEAFARSYAGCWESVEDYVSTLVNASEMDARAQRVIPERYAAYMTFDLAAYARDLQRGGDIHVVDDINGIFVFERTSE